MAIKATDLTGKKFGRLLVTAERVQHTGKKKCWKWVCICDCGRTTSATTGHLTSGDVRSCGCLRIETAAKISVTHGMASRGGDRTKEYRAWAHMLQRCYNPNDKSYPDYGGRGIRVCEEWKHDFVSFYREIGDAPSRSAMIGRIDNNSGYRPGNVRWETRIEQNRNKRSNVVVEWNGDKKTLSEWADELGIKNETLRKRIQCAGWSVERAMTEPVRRW
jgi:hypothetical protein